VLQKIGESDENYVFAAANGEHQTCVRVILDAEARGTAVAAKACKNALKK
jgi:hypothetical protein